MMSDNGTIAIKDLKKYLDHAAAQVQQYRVDIEKLEKKKIKAAEKRANGGKPISMFAKMLGVFSGHKSTTSTPTPSASTPAPVPVPTPLSIPPPVHSNSNCTPHSLNTSPMTNDHRTTTGDGSEMDTPASGKEPFAMLNGK